MARKSRRSRTRKRRRPSGARQGNYPSGRIEITRNGYGFVETEEGPFFIPAKSIGGAMPDDLVEVRPRSGGREPGQKRMASVARVHERATDHLVGELRLLEGLAVVVPQDPRIRYDLFIDSPLPKDVADGDVVLARITTFPSRHTSMQGYVIEALGRADAPGMDVDIIIHNAGLSTRFSDQALEQAEAMELGIAEALEERGRRDLRERDVITIDPADAKDFDDALSLDHVEGLVRLGVHIADVSSYVPWDSPVDICARDRATSVYLVDRVLPMLPEALSNDLCSLKPGCERRAMTCDMYLDEDAIVRRYEIYPSVIKSSRRFNYDEVQEILNGTARDPYASKLGELHRIAEKMLTRRIKLGSLEFDSREAKPVLDEDGHPIRIDVRSKTDATSLVEEAMICANQTVATHLFEAERPCVYRVHEAPSAGALESLLPVLKELGYPIEGLGAGKPQAFQRVLEHAAGRPEEALVNFMMVRSMERAYYTPQPDGHFGLACEHYCHFTSPIRRYPDLMVHRLLKDPRAMDGQVEWLARHSSKMERVAEEATRDSVELKICAYLADRIGETFEGTIAALSSSGITVRLDNTAEGLIRFDALHDEYYAHDAVRQVLVGEETGRTFRLGMRLRVTVASVDMRDMRVDFTLT